MMLRNSTIIFKVAGYFHPIIPIIKSNKNNGVFEQPCPIYNRTKVRQQESDVIYDFVITK